jgi:hypothetical protein
MEFSGLTARDVPAPATLAEDAAAFAVPVYGLVARPRLRFAGHGATRSNGTTESVAISYSYLAEPDDPDAVVNLVGNIDEVRGWMREAELDQQPDWFKGGVAAAQYPMLWEAVLIAIDPDEDRSLNGHLADHANHLLVNTMEHRRTLEPGRGVVLDNGVRASHAQPATVTVSGARLSGRVIDTDPDIVEWAVQVEHAVIVLGLPRDRADRLVLELGPVGTSDRA